MTSLLIFPLILLAVLAISIGGYYFNRSGPGDNVRNPNEKPRRNNWVP
jgi:hypothetical protein